MGTASPTDARPPAVCARCGYTAMDGLGVLVVEREGDAVRTRGRFCSAWCAMAHVGAVYDPNSGTSDLPPPAMPTGALQLLGDVHQRAVEDADAAWIRFRPVADSAVAEASNLMACAKAARDEHRHRSTQRGDKRSLRGSWRR